MKRQFFVSAWERAPGAVRSRIWMKQQFYEEKDETAFAISPG